MESEGSQGILARSGGFLATLAFGLVFSFGLGSGLPLHLIGIVSPAAFQRNNVIYNPSIAPSCGFPSYRAGMRAAELVLCVIGTQDSTTRVPSAALAPLGGEGWNS